MNSRNYIGTDRLTPPVAPIMGLHAAPPVIPKLYWDAYDDEQRIKMLWRCFGQIAEKVNQLSYYYIPTFDGGWSKSKEYAPLTVVSAPSGVDGVVKGDSYTALKWVPVNTPLTNEEYWARTGNYNAQIAAVENEVDDQLADVKKEVDDQLADVKKEVDDQLADVKSDIEDVTKRTNAAEKIIGEDAETRDHVIVCGDSFTAGTVGNFGKWTDLLPSKYTVYNHAANGSGFTTQGSGGASMLDQLNKAINAGEKAEIVLSYCGYNDLVTVSAEPNGIINAMTAWARRAHQAYPKARVIVVYGNVGNVTLSKYTGWPSRINTVFIGASSTETNFELYDAQDFLTPWGKNALQDDDLHPNETGKKIIAHKMLNIIAGGGLKPVNCFITNSIFNVINFTSTHNTGHTFTMKDVNVYQYVTDSEVIANISGTIENNNEITINETFETSTELLNERTLTCLFPPPTPFNYSATCTRLYMNINGTSMNEWYVVLEKGTTKVNQKFNAQVRFSRYHMTTM